jgi:hypothetical protein
MMHHRATGLNLKVFQLRRTLQKKIMQVPFDNKAKVVLVLNKFKHCAMKAYGGVDV